MSLPTVAVAIICKTPSPGMSKTRLSPPLLPEECAQISGCFIADLAATIDSMVGDGDVAGYAVYTPAGSEAQLRPLLPSGFDLVVQGDGHFGQRLERGIADLLALGHAGAILINSDSPTLPRSILRDAVDAVLAGDQVVLSPAIDGGYTLVGLSKLHPQLFADIPWSTDAVFRLTLDRAHAIGLPVAELGRWYDVDDVDSYRLLEQEIDGQRAAFMAVDTPLQVAPRTREFVLARRRSARNAPSTAQESSAGTPAANDSSFSEPSTRR